MKRNIIIGIVITAIVFLLALPKLQLWQNAKKESVATGATGGGGQRGGKLSVEAIIIKPSKLDNKLTVTGSVQANESLELKSEGSGKITGLYAAGRAAVGVASHSYVSGLSIAVCVFSGRRAGGHAAGNSKQG